MGEREKPCEVSLHVMNALIAFYANFGLLSRARRVFANIDAARKDIVSINSLMSALNKHGCFEEALDVYEAHQHSHFEGDGAETQSGKHDVAHVLALGALKELGCFEGGVA